MLEEPATFLVSAAGLLDLTCSHSTHRRWQLLDDALRPDAHLDDWARIGEDMGHMLIVSVGEHRDLLPGNMLKLAWRDYVAERLVEGLREERGEQDDQLRLL